MLFIAALLVGVNVGFLVEQRLRGTEDGAEKELATRATELVRGRDLREMSSQEVEALRQKLVPIARENLQHQLPRLVVPLLTVLVLLSLAAVIYVHHPTRIRRRHRTRPLNAADAPTVVSYLQSCAKNLGLSSLQLEFKSRRVFGAQAFGLRGNEVVLLHGTPELLERSWSNTTKAIALHEIGHFVNGDTQVGERARAIWIALVALLGLLFCGLVILAQLEPRGPGRLSGMAELGWRLAALLLLIKLIWTKLVSVREYYADQRVASWGLAGTLEQMLKPKLWEAQPKLWKRWWQWLEKRVEWIWKFHPSEEMRWRAFVDPVRLFRISPNLAFVTGVLLAVLLVNLLSPMAATIRMFSTLLSNSFWQSAAPLSTQLPAPWGRGFLLASAAGLSLGGTFGVFLLAVGGFSYLLAGTLGVQVQREAVADLVAGKRRTWGYGRLWWPALLLALGLETGFIIAPFNPGAPFSWKAWLLLIPWLTGLTCFTWLWLSYIRALTRFTLGLHVGVELPRRLRALVSGSAAALLTVLYCPAGFWRMTQTFWAQRAVGAADAREHFVYMYVGTGAILAILALVLYVVWAGTWLGVIYLRLRRWHSRCPVCHSAASPGFALGRFCTSCEGPLATWAYAAEGREPNA